MIIDHDHYLSPHYSHYDHDHVHGHFDMYNQAKKSGRKCTRKDLNNSKTSDFCDYLAKEETGQKVF